MADRTASVALELKASQFKAEATTVEAKVRSVDRAVDELDRDITKIPADAMKAGAAMKLLSGDIADVGTNFQRVGDKSSAMTVLDARIKNTRGEVKKLTEEFVKTGDVDVFRKLGQSSGELKSLTNFRKKLAKTLEDGAADGAKAATGTFSSMFQSGIVDTFKALPPEIKAGIIAGLAVAALAAIPVIVSAVDAALLLGIGAGGLAAGIMIAAQDANVQKAYGDLGSHIMSTLSRATMPFRSELISSATTFRDAFDKITPNIQRSFNTLSKAVQPIATGLSGLFTNAAPGIEKAFQGAIPLLREFGEWLPKLGSEIGDLGQALARAEPEAELFFKFLLANIDVAVKTITFLTNGVHALVGALMRMVGQYQPLSPALAEDTSALNNLSDAATTTGDSFADMLNQMNQVPKTADDVVVALKDKVLGNMMALDQATLGFDESLTKLTESLKKNGDTLNFHSKEGQANAEAMLAAVQANIKLFDANVAGGMSAANAAAQYDQNAAAIEAAGRKAGLTRQQINDLIGKYREVPKKIDTDIAAHGLTNAIKDLQETIILANNLDGKSIHINSYLHQHYTSTFDDMGLGHQGNAGPRALGGIRHAATGLIVGPSTPGTLIGEPQTGGEALIPMRGITQSRAMSLAQTAVGGYGLQVSPRGGQSQVVVVSGELRITGPNTALGGMLMDMNRKGDLQFVVRTS